MNVLARIATPSASPKINRVIGALIAVFTLLLLLSLASYSPLDPSINTSAPAIAGARLTHNWIGLFGSYLSDMLLQGFGVVAFALPLALGVLAWRWIECKPLDSPGSKLLGATTLTLFVAGLLAIQPLHWRWLHVVPVEGLLGRLMGEALLRGFNVVGAYIVSATVIALAIYLTTAFSFSRAQSWLAERVGRIITARERWRAACQEKARLRAERDMEKRRLAIERRQQKEEAALQKREAKLKKKQPAEPVELPFDGPAVVVDDMSARRRVAPSAPVAAPAADPYAAVTMDESPIAETYSEEPPAPAAAEFDAYAPIAATPSAVAAGMAVTATAAELAREALDAHQSAANAYPAPRIGARSSNAPAAVAPRAQTGPWVLPSSALLAPAEARSEFNAQELKELAVTLTNKCAEFGVNGHVAQINPGPVVTTFEFKPEAGVKLSRIMGLSEDLCLAMSAESILIERMPGRPTVGIQAPNAKRETIRLREVIESEEFHSKKSPLTVALGKDINGRIKVAEINTMPHLLIAGSTGSGKSVAVNAFIMSILLKATPDEVRLILVDPKRLELTNYEGVPHLYTPIIVEPKLASNALRNAVREMERRLKVMAAVGVRNLDQYNKLFEHGVTPGLFDKVEEGELKPMPYIVIIIDELADLMMIDGANVEESITRLAQMARAVGIHLVLATQRPSVDVITGLIKANFPARISFRVASKIDSRTILDANGAEHLLGKGDMLYLPNGSSRQHRMHAPFVTEQEISGVVDFWKQQATAQYDEQFLKAPAGEEGGGSFDGEDSSGDEDPMYQDAVRLVLEFGKASTSLIQRRLRVGYGRAAHMIDTMEADGIVGPADGPKPREILKRPDWLSEIDDSLR